MAKQITTDNRFRVFASTGYPESLVSDWYEILTQTHIPTIISPLHDKDINPTGEPKKPHYHIMLVYSGKKNPEQPKAIFDAIHSVGCEIIGDLRGMARYFCHLDNPEKAQYDIDDVRTLAGIDYQAIITMSSDKYSIIGQMLEFIEVNQVESFSQFFLWTYRNESKWFRALCDNSAYVIREHIKSRQFTLEHNLYADTEKWHMSEPPTEGGKDSGDK